MYNIVYISVGTFWKIAKLKTFEHNDVLFKDIAKKKDITVHIGLPMNGDTYLSKLLNGNDKMVTDTWKKIPYKIYDGFYKGEVDSVFINAFETYSDTRTPSGEIITSDDVINYICSTCDYCVANNKPIVLYDPDNFINLNIKTKNNSESIPKLIYNKYKDYNRFYLSGPFMYGVYNDCVNDYTFIPFGLDKDDKQEINPFSEREYVTRYVGNNYFRDHFIPYFEKCSNYGKTTVNGYNWGNASKNNKFPNLEFGKSFPLSGNKVKEFFRNVKIGLYGTTKEFRNDGHFTLRIREYYQAGIFVVPESIDYMIDAICLDDYKITCDNIEDFNFNMTDEEYKILVERQREKLSELFDISQYSDLLINKVFMI